MLRKCTQKLRGNIVESRRQVFPDDQTTRNSKKDGLKPFAKISFYLDLKDYVNLKNLINDIKILGGSVETFLSKDVKFVVTNRPNWKQQMTNRSLGDGSLPSTPNSVSNTKSGITNNSPRNWDSPKDNNMPIVATSRASVILEQARKSATKGSSDVLHIARMWGVQVVSLASVINSIKRSKNQKAFARPSSTKPISRMKLKPTQVLKTKLVGPYVKFEDFSSVYRPQYRQFREWPELNLNSDHARSPFTKASKKSIPKADALQYKHASPPLPLKENHDKNESPRPLTSSKSTVSKDIDASLKPGFCEMCLRRYENLYKHIEEDEHRSHLEVPGFYAELDKKIAMLPNLFTSAKMFVQDLSLKGNVAANAKLKRKKESLNLPILDPACQKRRQQMETSQPSMKKHKLSVIDAENCEPVSDTDHFPATQQYNGSPAKVENSKPFKESYVDIVGNAKDSFVTRQTFKSIGSMPPKRKALEPLVQNICKPLPFGTSSNQDLQNFGLENPIRSSEKASYDEKPESIKVLRSTAMRRISACQSSSKVSSSPSFHSSVRCDLTNSRKANSSPVDSAFAKIKTPPRVCRTLDLGNKSPARRRRCFLDATQKMKDMADELEFIANLDNPSFDIQNHDALTNLPLECMEPLSPLKPSPLPRVGPMTPTRGLKIDLHQKMDGPCTPNATEISANDLFNCSSDTGIFSVKCNNDISAVTNIVQPISCSYATVPFPPLKPSPLPCVVPMDVPLAPNPTEISTMPLINDCLESRSDIDVCAVKCNDISALPCVIPMPAIRSLKIGLHQEMDGPCTPNPTEISEINDRFESSSDGDIGSVESDDSSDVTSIVQPISGSSSTNQVGKEKEKLLPDAWESNLLVQSWCNEQLGVVTNCVQATEASLIGKSKESVCAIKGQEVQNFDTTLDLSLKKDIVNTSGNSRNQDVQTSPKKTESKCGSSAKSDSPSQHSQSSVFNLISSPVLLHHSNVKVVPQNEGVIPKFVFKRIRGENSNEWTVRVLSDDSGVA